MANKGVRRPIPKDAVARLMYESALTCCICCDRTKDVQIHHIDENHNNNDISNLCVICPECHRKTMQKGGFVRALDATTVELHKNEWHEIVSKKRLEESKVRDIVGTFFPTLDVDFGSLPALGEVNAPVKLVIFSDFSAPFCGKFNFEAERQVREKYILAGKISLYFRDFPLGFHVNAIPAAIAARASAKFGKFWKMKDMLFEKQNEWAKIKDPKNLFLRYATEIGISRDEFGIAYNDSGNVNDLNTDMAKAQTIGVSGVPSSFLIIPKNVLPTYLVLKSVSALESEFGAGSFEPYENGDKYVLIVPGAYPFAAFEQILSQLKW